VPAANPKPVTATAPYSSVAARIFLRGRVVFTVRPFVHALRRLTSLAEADIT
jgi:hypothetical protein